ncbi:MAG: ATP-binding protein [Myxococcota bacterium]
MTEPTHNLPRRRKRFIGRERELELIAQHLEEYPLVTILAGGGMGKTRLAMQFGANTRDFERVVFCDVTEARDEEVFAACVAREFSGFDGVRAPEDVGRHLAGAGRALVIIDNLEQVVAPAARVVRRWLEQAPNISFLATSREPLHLRGERRLPLSPLEIERAVELFEHRARKARHDFSVDDNNRETVSAIVEHLDGLPLAVELAAARINVFAPANILERLKGEHGGLDTLVRKTRHATVRHQTMRGTLEWSWDLLEDDERRVLAGSSVFRGGFDLRAAEDVLSTEGSRWVGDVLESLSDKSLLIAELRENPDGRQDRRFRLFETTARFAASMLDDELRRELARLHAWHYVERIEDHRGAPLIHETQNAVRAFWSAAEFDDNLAGRAALCATRLLRLRGAVEERLEIIGTALDGEIDDPKLRAKLLSARTSCHLVRGEFSAALRDIDRGIEAADTANSRSTRAFLLYSKSEALRGRGHPTEAREPLNEALEIAESRGDYRAESTLRAALADIDFDLGRAEKATSTWHRALELAHRKKFRDLRGKILVQMGRSDMLYGDLDSARRRLEDANKSQKQPSTELQRARHETLAEIAWLEDDESGARDHLTRALTLGTKTQDYRDPIVAHFGLAAIERRVDPDATDAHLDAVRELVWDNEDVFNRVQVHVRLGIFRLFRGACREATHLFDRAVDEASRLDDARIQPHAMTWLGIAFAMGDKSDKASQQLDEAEHGFHAAGFEALADQIDAYRRAVKPLVEGAPAATRDTVSALRDSAERFRFQSNVRLSSWRFYDPLSSLADILETASTDDEPEDALVVARDGSMFELPDGERVDLSSRQALRLILAELGTLRQAAPGDGISVDELRHVGWPDETLTEEAGSSRVYTAIRNLRSMGLDGVLLTGHTGYFLDPEIPFRWAR